MATIRLLTSQEKITKLNFNKGSEMESPHSVFANEIKVGRK